MKIWATLLTDASYLPGVLTLAYSLHKVGSKYELVVLYTDALEKAALSELALRNIHVIRLEALRPTYATGAAETRFDETFSKLHAYGMTQYERIGMLDADMLVRKNIDELMEMPIAQDTIAATHACVCNPLRKATYPASWVPENCAYSQQTRVEAQSKGVRCNYGIGELNGGLIILQPGAEVHHKVMRVFDEECAAGRILQFADQTLQSMAFAGQWVPLPYIYNALKTLRECHAEIWDDDHVKIVHYIMAKPWNDKDGGDKTQPTHAWWRAENEERRMAENRG